MYRGTTPTLFLELKTDLSLDNLAELWVTFKSIKGEKKREVTKSLEDEAIAVDAEHKTILVKLTQEDTLTLIDGTCDVQVRFRTIDDLAYASTVERVSVERILKEGVI